MSDTIESPYDYPEHPLPVRLIAVSADCDPSEIDRTDGSYEQVVGILAENDYAGLLAIAETMGLEGDWGTDDVEEAVTEALHEYRELRDRPEPRVWLPGDAVPAEVWVLDHEGYVSGTPDAKQITARIPLVEVFVPDFAAAVAAEQARRTADDGEVSRG